MLPCTSALRSRTSRSQRYIRDTHQVGDYVFQGGDHDIRANQYEHRSQSHTHAVDGRRGRSKVGHIPNSNTNVGFSVMIPFINIFRLLIALSSLFICYQLKWHPLIRLRLRMRYTHGSRHRGTHGWRWSLRDSVHVATIFCYF